MTLLVTGANGFVGRALVAHMARTSDEALLAAVRHPAENFPATARQVLMPEIATADWRPFLSGVDKVVHLAARVHVADQVTAESIDAYRRVNVEGTVNLARQAAELGVRRFVFVSTAKVNGERTSIGRPFAESDQAAPSGPYAMSKAEAEARLFALGAETGMEIVVLRPTLVYGPGVRANFSSMIRWIRRGIPLPLGGLRHNRRSLVAIDNLVDLIALCLHHPAAADEVFFASDAEAVSTTELLQRTAAAMAVPARLIPVPGGILRAASIMLGRRDIWRRLGESLEVDVAKSRALLGWAPPVSLDEGLRRAVSVGGNRG